jgi:2-oxo-4-hydroxy-4-carboxy-5-ureidoimidazoline decarboxylase
MNHNSVVALSLLSNLVLSQELYKCCGCKVWVDNMIKLLPFTSVEDLIDKANSTWWFLPVDQWKVAFSAHPKIGKVSLYFCFKTISF